MKVQAWVNLYCYGFFVSGDQVVCIGFDDDFRIPFEVALSSMYELNTIQ